MKVMMEQCIISCWNEDGHLNLFETAFPSLTLAGFIGKAITKLLEG
jgi:hypothetical protein